MLTTEQVIKRSDKLHSRKDQLNQLHQVLADNFYPERANFVYQRAVGDEYADHLLDSFPVIARRDLGDMIGSMLRDGEWFRITVVGDEDENEELSLSHDSKQYLEFLAKRQRKLMDLRMTGFSRATSEGDQDFVTFGSPVLSCEMNLRARSPHLLYRCWHLKDVAWAENDAGEINFITRKWRPELQHLRRLFPGKLHPSHEQMARDDPMREVNCVHVVMDSETYGREEWIRFPWISLYIDKDNMHELEAVPTTSKRYIIPRFRTVSGSQYAHSPATMVAVPQSRLVQAITRTLLEAGERFTDPPVIATDNVIRSDLNLYSGGVTWVDHEYDERLGEVLRPMPTDKSGMPYGFDTHQQFRELISLAFFENKLNVPLADKEMTAYEYRKRLQEWRRRALPLFSPIEDDYNGQLCEVTFETLQQFNMFGPPQNTPRELQDREIAFRFKSPLSEAEEEEKIFAFNQAVDTTLKAQQVDPMVATHFDLDYAYRDTVSGMKAPEKWLRDEKEAMKRKMAAIQAAEQTAQSVAEDGEGGGDVVPMRRGAGG